MAASSTEIIFVTGAPGSGKTTACEHYADMYASEGVTHFSAGEHIRRVLSGAIASSVPLESTKPPASQVLALMHEALGARKGTVLLDGFPRFLNESSYLQELAKYRLKGCVALQLDQPTSIARVVARGQRPGEQQSRQDLRSHAVTRFTEEYMGQTAPVIDELIAVHKLPLQVVDAAQSQSIVAADFAHAVDTLRA